MSAGTWECRVTGERLGKLGCAETRLALTDVERDGVCVACMAARKAKRTRKEGDAVANDRKSTMGVCLSPECPRVDQEVRIAAHGLCTCCYDRWRRGKIKDADLERWRRERDADKAAAAKPATVPEAPVVLDGPSEQTPTEIFEAQNKITESVKEGYRQAIEELEAVPDGESILSTMEWFTPGTKHYEPALNIHGQHHDYLNVNVAAARMYGLLEFRYVRIGFDRQTRTIVLQPTHVRTGAMSLVGGGRKIAAKAFCRRFGIDSTGPWPLRKMDGYLVAEIGGGE